MNVGLKKAEISGKPTMEDVIQLTLWMSFYQPHKMTSQTLHPY